MRQFIVILILFVCVKLSNSLILIINLFHCAPPTERSSEAFGFVHLGWSFRAILELGIWQATEDARRAVYKKFFFNPATALINRALE